MSDRFAGWAMGRSAPGLSLLLGAFCALSFAPHSWWPLSILSLTALWGLWSRQSRSQAAVCGLAFGVGLFTAGTYWTYTAVHGFGGAPVALSLFLSGALVLVMALYYALVGALYVGLRRRAPRWDCLIFLPATWVLMEWFRGWFLTGFPWLALGYGQLDTPLAGYAPVLGVYGVSLAVCVVAASLLLALQGQRLLGGLVVIAVYAIGAILQQVSFVHPSGAPVSVAIVQGAVPQDEKWQATNQIPTQRLYARLSATAFGSRIILWPEAALPQLYHEVVPFLADFYANAHAQGSDLVLGLLRYDPDTDSIRNGLLALGDDEQWYYKRHLVPFGEYFPVPDFLRSWMRIQNMTFVDLAPGHSGQPPLTVGGLRLGETICYEDSYGAEQLAILTQANVLVNVSNDAWYGDSSAAHEHLEITRMRALEAGRYMMRATNNGISAIIANDGHLVARSAQFVPQVLKGEVIPFEGLTLYARWGNYPVLLSCFAGLLLSIALRWLQRA